MERNGKGLQTKLQFGTIIKLIANLLRVTEKVAAVIITGKLEKRKSRIKKKGKC